MLCSIALSGFSTHFPPPLSYPCPTAAHPPPCLLHDVLAFVLFSLLGCDFYNKLCYSLFGENSNRRKRTKLSLNDFPLWSSLCSMPVLIFLLRKADPGVVHFSETISLHIRIHKISWPWPAPHEQKVISASLSEVSPSIKWWQCSLLLPVTLMWWGSMPQSLESAWRSSGDSVL